MRANDKLQFRNSGVEMQHINTANVIAEYENDIEEEFDETELTAGDSIAESNEPVAAVVVNEEMNADGESAFKECKNCHETKPIGDFGKTMGKIRAICKKCVNAKHKEWRTAKAAKNEAEAKANVENAVAEGNVVEVDVNE